MRIDILLKYIHIPIMSMADSNGHDYRLVALTGDADVWSRDIIGFLIVNRYVLSLSKARTPL